MKSTMFSFILLLSITLSGMEAMSQTLVKPCGTPAIRVNGGNTVSQVTVNQATSYTFQALVCSGSVRWTIGGQASVTTSTSSITLSGSDFLWLPAGGCEEFNQNLSNGNYYTTLTAEGISSNRSVTITVIVTGVNECSYGFPKPSLKKPGFGG